MKIIFTTCCGTYPTWTAWTVASVYNVVDEIIVINGGHKIGDFDAGDDFTLERDRDQLKDIDKDNKITQIKPNWKNAQYSTKGRDEAGRARNIALGFKYAYDSGANWVLKCDADQVFTHKLSRGFLEELANNDKGIKGYVFNQPADWYRDFEHVSASVPDDLCNDGAVFFEAHKKAASVGQGSPIIGDQEHEYDECVMTHHLRRVPPPDMDEFEYHYKRYYYHTAGPNSIMEYPFNKIYGRKMTEEEVHEKATEQANAMMVESGAPLHQFIGVKGYPQWIPKVVEVGPKNYIDMGYPVK